MVVSSLPGANRSGFRDGIAPGVSPNFRGRQWREVAVRTLAGMRTLCQRDVAEFGGHNDALPDACRSRPARREIPGHQYQARQGGWADRGARAGGGSEAARLADHGRWHDRHVAWGRAGAARRTAGRDGRSRRAVALGVRSCSGATLRRQHDPSARAEFLGRSRVSRVSVAVGAPLMICSQQTTLANARTEADGAVSAMADAAEG